MRWTQEVRRFKPSTVSRRMAVVCGFYRTCVIDGIWKHFPAAEYVRRPVVPPESPTLGLSRLQFDQVAVDAGGSRGVGTSTDAVAAPPSVRRSLSCLEWAAEICSGVSRTRRISSRVRVASRRAGVGHRDLRVGRVDRVAPVGFGVTRQRWP